ncbi:MAG: adenosylcobalamin-dependent ribonucleoside-diphosphate reductase [bacterium]
MKYGPITEFSDNLHYEKYRLKNETFVCSMNRIASDSANGGKHFSVINDILKNMYFLPAGRIQSTLGSPQQTTPFNCFVSGKITDSFVDGYGSIMHRATEAAKTMRMGGGIGYDFSTLRPNGAIIKKIRSDSSGPTSFIDIFNSVGKCISSSGHRRGAQLAALNIGHPDIEEYINVKQNTHMLTNFNLSVSVTDEFMNSLIQNKPFFDLKFNNIVYAQVNPKKLWEMLMRSCYDWGEPGILFVDTINRMNNLKYCEDIRTTNPCGEQPLPPFGACLLGSFNLVKYIKYVDKMVVFDYKMLISHIKPIVMMFDNIISTARYPLLAHEVEATTKRRMGLGITGLANSAEFLGFKYGSDEFMVFLRKILQILRNESYKASIDLAIEKGAFPMYEREKYISSEFIKTLPEKIQNDIYENGIRNSHLTCIAPTGTISLCADNISSGIEPVFQHETLRNVKLKSGNHKFILKDYAYNFFGLKGMLAGNVPIKDHINILSESQRNVDGAVSKTCNINASLGWEEFKDIYITAWKNGCKGCTVFNSDGKRKGIFNETEGRGCSIDKKTGVKDCE